MKRKSTATRRETKLRPPHYANTEYTQKKERKPKTLGNHHLLMVFRQPDVRGTEVLA